MELKMLSDFLHFKPFPLPWEPCSFWTHHLRWRQLLRIIVKVYDRVSECSLHLRITHSCHKPRHGPKWETILSCEKKVSFDTVLVSGVWCGDSTRPFSIGLLLQLTPHRKFMSTSDPSTVLHGFRKENLPIRRRLTMENPAMQKARIFGRLIVIIFRCLYCWTV